MCVFFARMFYSYIWNTKFEVISRPILQLRILLWSLLRYVEIREQNEGRVTSYEYKDVPHTVHVRKIDVKPRVAEHTVCDP